MSLAPSLTESPLFVDLVSQVAALAGQVAALTREQNRILDRVGRLDGIILNGEPIVCVAKVVRIPGIREFLEDWCEFDPTYRIPIADLYSGWTAFCASKGLAIPTTSVAFGKYMRKAVHTLQAVQVRMPDGTKPRHYLGIRLRPTCPFLS